MNLGELIEMTRERCGLLAQDQSATDATMTRLVNSALHWVERRNPKGWQWLRVGGTWTAPASPPDSVALTSVFGTSTVWKVTEVRLVTPGGYSPSLPRLARTALLEDWSNTPGTPEAWAVDGGRLWLRPIPLAGSVVRSYGVGTEADLASLGDEPLMPEVHHDAIVERAASLLFRRIHDTTESTIAAANADQLVREMLAYDVPYTGPGQIQTRA